MQKVESSNRRKVYITFRRCGKNGIDCVMRVGCGAMREGIHHQTGTCFSNGSEIVNVEPLPSALCTVMSPPWRFTISQAIYKPIPKPLNVLVLGSCTR